MAPPLSQRIADCVPDVTDAFHRLILVVGPARTGKTKALQALARAHDWPLVNVNLELSERLLDLTTKQRALRAPRLLGEITDGRQGHVVLLDNTEILFSTELQQDPLRLLQGLARNRTVVASWSGEIDDESLVYAAPGHPEHRRCLRPQATVVPTSDAQTRTEHDHLGLQSPHKETTP